MICVVDNNHHLKPYTFNDEYTILSNEDAIVDAFLTFLDWAISFIQEVVDMVFGPIVDAIMNAVDSYTNGISSATGHAKNDMINSGTVSQSSASMLSDAILGDFFWLILGIAVVAEIVLTLLTPITSVFGFLLTFAVTIIAIILIEQALGGYYKETQDSIDENTPNTACVVRGLMADMGAPGPVTQEEKESQEGLDWQLAWNLFSIPCGLSSIIFGASALEQAKTAGGVSSFAKKATGWAIAMTVGGIAVALIAEGIDSFEMGWIAATMSFIGMELGFASLSKGAPLMVKTLSVLSWISGGVGIYFSAQALKLSYQGE